MALHCNELILADRDRLEKIAQKGSPGKEDNAWLLELARKYRVVDDKATDVGKKQIDVLLSRVDIIPPSLALAQDAHESGWGTSRFAEAGNFLFGQWTWGGKGIASKERQAGKGNYKVASFDTPIGSVAAYMLNLNSYSCYASFQTNGAKLRRQGKKQPV